jgi:hypothetical protein
MMNTLPNWTRSMNEPPNEWLRRLFEYEFCPECGGDAEDHEVCIVLGIGTYFARCKLSPFADTTGEGVNKILTDRASQLSPLPASP